MKGMNTLVDQETGEPVSLSSRFCRDSERWKDTTTPSLEEFFSLQTLDLHSSRYIHSLHDSVCTLTNLKVLILSKCDRLQKLPDAIGNLVNLEEVRRYSVLFVLSEKFALVAEKLTIYACGPWL